MTKTLMGKPRSDELPPLPEPQESSEDENSKRQMRKVMRTEVEELGYRDENTKVSGDRKKCLSYLCIIKERVARRSCKFVFYQIVG